MCSSNLDFLIIETVPSKALCMFGTADRSTNLFNITLLHISIVNIDQYKYTYWKGPQIRQLETDFSAAEAFLKYAIDKLPTGWLKFSPCIDTEVFHGRVDWGTHVHRSSPQLWFLHFKTFVIQESWVAISLIFLTRTNGNWFWRGWVSKQFFTRLRTAC